jgi:beta-lactamase class A
LAKKPSGAPSSAHGANRQSSAGYFEQRAAAGPRVAFRLPPVSALIARGLVILFVLTATWKLATLGWETYQASRFIRPTIASPVSLPSALVVDPELHAIVRQAGLPGGVVGVYVRSLTNGAGAETNAERRFPAASLSKLAVMVEVFKQQRLRKFAWSDELTLGREHWADGSGVLQARIGQSLAIGELQRLMIQESDNIAANVLTDLVGVANINQTMEALGLRNTRVTERSRETALPTTSPEDLGRLLEITATGRLVDAQTSEEAVRLLERKQAQSWLAAGLPWWGKLAHKWGDLPNARHDAGILYTPRNQIVLVVLTENGTPAAAAEQIGTISRDVMSYFENRST